MTHHNQMSYRMRKEPGYAKKVMIQLNNYYNKEIQRDHINTLSRDPSTQRGSGLRYLNNDTNEGSSSIFNFGNMRSMPMTPEGDINNSQESNNTGLMKGLQKYQNNMMGPPSPGILKTTLPQLDKNKIDQISDEESEQSSEMTEVSEYDESSDFVSERLTTPGYSVRSMGRRSAELRERLKNATYQERNRIFHEVMEPFKSIVIQPTGTALNKSAKLDLPVFTLRELPVKEQYKRALKKIKD